MSQPVNDAVSRGLTLRDSTTRCCWRAAPRNAHLWQNGCRSGAAWTFFAPAAVWHKQTRIPGKSSCVQVGGYRPCPSRDRRGNRAANWWCENCQPYPSYSAEILWPGVRLRARCRCVNLGHVYPTPTFVGPCLSMLGQTPPTGRAGFIRQKGTAIDVSSSKMASRSGFFQKTVRSGPPNCPRWRRPSLNFQPAPPSLDG